jgi:hypothetical protein
VRTHPTQRQTIGFVLALAAVATAFAFRFRAAPPLLVGFGGFAALLLSISPSAKLRLAAFLAVNWLTRPLRWLVPRLALLFVYYLVLTPIGLGLRVARRNLRARREPTWQVRSEQPEAERYLRQY